MRGARAQLGHAPRPSYFAGPGMVTTVGHPGHRGQEVWVCPKCSARISARGLGFFRPADGWRNGALAGAQCFAGCGNWCDEGGADGVSN